MRKFKQKSRGSQEIRGGENWLKGQERVSKGDQELNERKAKQGISGVQKNKGEQSNSGAN